MNLNHKVILAVFMAFAAILPSQAQSAKKIHEQMHSQLLSNAKNTIDKSALQEYIKREIEVKEQKVGQYEGLSEESMALITDLLDEASTHLGKKYVYGSKGPNTFDCSGFTSYVYNQFGYKITSSSRGQYTLGDGVSKNHLRPGDLVFFQGRSGTGGVGHVGIVVKADNEKGTFRFIHASVSNGIRYSENTETYYAKRYIGARRIITE